MIRLIRAEERARPNLRGGKLWSQHLVAPVARRSTAPHVPLTVTLDEVLLGGGAPEPEAEPDSVEGITYVFEGGLDPAPPMKAMLAGDFHYRCRRRRGAVPFALSHAGGRGARLFRLWFHAGAELRHLPSRLHRVGMANQRDRLCLIASPDGRRGSLPLRHDVAFFSSSLEQGTHVSHALGAGRFAWIYVVRGGLLLNNIKLRDGDAATVDELMGISLLASTPVELLLVDMGLAPPVRRGEPRQARVLSDRPSK